MSDPARPTVNGAEASVRDMTAADLAEVLQIERRVQASPWSRLAFEEALTRQEGGVTAGATALDALDGRIADNYLCRVVLVGDLLAGFHIASTVLDELHILNLAVTPTCQGMGVGHVIMNDFRRLAQARNLKRQFLEVRSANITAQNLYSKWGFAQIAVRKNYYRLPDGGREDAQVYVYKE